MALSKLHVDGIWIKDEASNRIQLRGAGCDYTAYGRPAWLNTFIDWMKDCNCNCMRLAFCVPDYRVQQTEYDPDKMDATLALLEANDLYAILDCHHYWATSEVQGWEDVLPNHKADWIQCWVDIANKYKNNTSIAMFELDNEPYGSGGSELRNVYYDCINAIRATGDEHIVCCSIPERTRIYEAEEATATWTDSSQILSNMCLNIHNWHHYNPDAYFKDNESAGYEVAEMVVSEWIATALNYRNNLDCPIVLGEFGVYNYDMDSADVRDMQLKIQYAEEMGLPWWAWMCEKWRENNFWRDFIALKIIDDFPPSILWPDIPYYSGFDLHTFPAKPFNIWDHIDEDASTTRIRETGYNAWGVCLVTIPQNYPVVFVGKCTLRVQVWSPGHPYWGTISNDYYVSLDQGETWTIGNEENPVEGYTVVYVWDTTSQPEPPPPPPTKYFTVTASADANGSVDPSGEYTIEVSDYFTCTATPDANYKFSHWTLNGVNVSTQHVYTFTGLADANYILIAYFTYVAPPAPTKFTVVISSTDGGSTDPEGSQEVDADTGVSVDAIADEDYSFSYWLRNGVNVGSDNPYTMNGVAGGQYTLVAHFTYTPPPLVTTYYTVIVSAGSNGSVNPSGTFQMDTDSPFTCTAIPNANYQLLYWLLNGAVASTNITYSFTGAAEATYTLKAFFEEKPVPEPPDEPPSPPPAHFSVAIASSVGGTTSPATGNYEVSTEDTLYVEALPDTNYVLSYWLLDGSDVGAANPYGVTGEDGQQRTLRPYFQYVSPDLEAIRGDSELFNLLVRGGESVGDVDFQGLVRGLE